MTPVTSISTINNDTVFHSEEGNHCIYIHGPIRAPHHYTKEFELLRNAKEDEIINIYFCTPGGYLSTAAHFISLFDSCKANLVGHLVGPVASAGTVMALRMDDLAIYDFCYMMMHNYSGGGWGKGDDLVLSVLNDDAWVKTIMRDCYKNFLTEDEIEKEIFKNQDIYLHPDQIMERWERVLQYRELQAQEATDFLEDKAIKELVEQHRDKIQKFLLQNS